MDLNINLRQNQLTRLQNYLKDVDIEVTMILQNLQWDRTYLAERKTMVTCQYDKNHRVPPDKLAEHENGCFLKSQGYTEYDRLLSSPINPDATSVVKLSADNIQEILNNASDCQPLLRTGTGCSRHQPLTLERLQAMYTADERRVIHDAVVNRVPSCHDLSDLACLSSKDDVGKESKTKSKLEILAELRDMRRRRTKYRVAAKTRNYSDVLRDVISTQMELYIQAHNTMSQTHMKNNDPDSGNASDGNKKNTNRYYDNIPNRSCHYNERQTSIDTKHMCNDIHDTVRHSKYHNDHKIRKRKHDDSGFGSYSRFSEIQDYKESTFGKPDQFKESVHYDSRTKKRVDGDNYGKSNRTRDKDHYEIHNRHNSKEYDRIGKSQTEKQVFDTSKDKIKERCNDYRKLREKYNSHERHHSNREREDHYQYRHKYDVDRQKTHEYKQKQNQTVLIKKERNYCFDDDSNSSESGETDYSGKISHYSNLKKIKIEKEARIKREESDSSFDRAKDYGPKSSNKFNECQKSKILHNRLCDSAARREKYVYSKKHKERTQKEREETAIHKIKEEKNVMYKETLNINEGNQEKQDVGNYKNRNERYTSSADEYRKYKEKEKEKTPGKH